MTFILRVKNAPSPATQWMATCSPGPTMPSPLPLAQRWDSAEPAPGATVLDIACFDAAGSIVQESMVTVTIEDRDYIFDFATETLQLTTVPAGCLPLVIIGGLGILGVVGAAVAFAIA